MQGTARPGGFAFSQASYNASAVFSVTFYLTQGLTSRGRIGINSDLKGYPMVQPWLQDPQDQTALVSGITDAIADLAKNGES